MARFRFTGQYQVTSWVICRQTAIAFTPSDASRFQGRDDVREDVYLTATGIPGRSLMAVPKNLPLTRQLAANPS